MTRAIAWFAGNHVAANLLMVLLVVGGLTALPAIQQKTFPDIDIEIVQVGVAYLGAAPEEVEEAVCVRIEEEIQGVDGIQKITSSASEGACGVTVELISGYPVDRALTQIKNAVDAIDTFPEDTEKPVVTHFQQQRNAIQIALYGPASERTLKTVGERVRDDIAALPDVTQVSIAGTRPYEVSIEVPEESLRRHGLSFDQIAAAVRRGSLDRPGGSIKTEGGEVLLRTKGQAYTRADFERIVVLTREDGTRLLVGDVAHVVDGFEDEPRFAFFDGQPAVMIQVMRVGQQRVLELVETVKDYVATRTRLPAGLQAAVWRDNSQVLRDRLDILLRNGRGGFILVFLVLALFLRLRLAFWVSVGVPISFLGALWLFPVLDLSIDVISAFAFILVLGLLVDDAIVVGENVHRHQERDEEPLAASIRGAQEVSVPVIFGVLTTVAAFMPMILAPGFLGQVFGAIGTVVVCCLVFSVLESQLVLPAHLGHMKAKARREVSPGGIQARWKRIQTALASSLERLAHDVYRPALSRVIEWRYATLASGIVALMLCVSVVATGRLHFTFFPEIESDYISARLTMPQGTPVETTAAIIHQLEASAQRLSESLDAEVTVDGQSIVKHVFAAVGEIPSQGGPGPPSGPRGRSAGSHIGEVSIELIGGDVRPISAKVIAQRWRELTPPIPGVEQLVFSSALFSAGNPIELQLQAANVDELILAADALKERLSEYPGVFDVADSFRGGKEEIRLDILPAAQTLGLSLDDLSRQVRQAFYGDEAQRIQRGRDDVRVMVRYPESRRRSLSDLDELRIRTPDGAEVPFYAVAEGSRVRGYATIRRADRQRVINVSADVDVTRANANQVLADLRGDFLPALEAEFPGLSYTLEGAQEEQRKTLGALMRNYGFALILIYALLAVPLRSYTQPLIIMAVIPFGLVGAILGHLIMRMDLSIFSVFGVVALSGVVVNSSLVLVHYVNARRAEGQSAVEAVRSAGVARFRPIVLTSLTTFAGLTPLLSEGSVSAQFLIPMATSLGFGVVFATVISLFLVPASYVILEDLGGLVSRRGPPKLAPVASAPPARAASAER